MFERTFKFHIVKIGAVLCAAALLCGVNAYASGITYHGRLLNPDSTPVTDSSVQFKMDILTPDSQSCLMYEELQTKNLSSTLGAFSITINDGSGSRTDSSGYSFDQVFGNIGTLTFAPATCSSGTGSYTPATGDGRTFQVYFKTSTMSTWEPMPAQSINFSPFAIEAKQVSGFPAASLLRVQQASGAPGTATPLSPTDFSNLQTLLAGTSTQYVQSGTNGAPIPSMASNPGTPSAGDIWFNSTSKTLDYYDGTAVQTVGTGGGAGTVTSVATGTGLTGGPITSSGTISLATVGTAGTYTKVTTDAYGRVTAGTQITGNDITSGTIGGSTSMSTTGSVSAASVSSTTDSTNNLWIYEGTNTHKVKITAPASLAADYGLTLPTTEPAANGYMLVSDTSGNLSWAAPSGGSVTSVATGTGLTGGPISTTGTISLSPPTTSAIGGVEAINQVSHEWIQYIDTAGVPHLAQPDFSDLTGTANVFLDGGNSFGAAASLGTNDANTLSLKTNNATRLFIDASGDLGVGTTSPTAALQLKGGVATAGGAPLKLTAGTSLTTPEPGAIEYDGTSLFYTDSSSVRHTLAAAGAGITALTGDVSASGSGSVAATVNTVGGSTAANVHTAEVAANAATNANTASTIVKRDASGNFSAGAVSVGSSIFRDTGSNTVTLEAPTTVTSYVLKLPASQGVANTVLTEDGSGNLTWSAPAVSGAATLASGDMWVGNGSNVATAVAMSGDATLASSGTLTLAPSGVTAATYGSATQVPQIAVDAKGRITSASNVSIPTATGTQLGLMEVGTGLSVAAGVVSVANTGATGAYLNGGNSFGQAATIGTNDANTLGFLTNGTTQMTIDTAGHVGIGTTSPAAPLDVNGAIDISGLNGIWYPTTDSTAGASIAIGPGALAHEGSLASTAFGNIAIGSQALGSSGLTTAAVNNIAIGVNTLKGNTSGTNNAAFGWSALYSITTGGQNTGLGVQAATWLGSSSSRNTAIGYGALNQPGTSNDNTAVGTNALSYEASGGGNTALGSYAGAGTAASTAANSTFVGFDAGRDISTGNANVTLGYKAGYDLTSGSDNIIIGPYATTGVGVTTGSNNILIGQDVRPVFQGGSNQLNIGNLITATGLSSGTTVSTGNVGIGTTLPNDTLDIQGSSTGPSGVTVGVTNLATGIAAVELGSGIGQLSLLYNPTTGNVNGAPPSTAGVLANGFIPLVLGTNAAEHMRIDTAGNVGIGTTSPTAALQLKAGVAAAGGAPLKLTAGTSLTTPEPGAIEYDGTSLFYTDSSSVRHTLAAAGGGITALTGDVTASGSGSVAATLATTGVTAATYGSATQVPQIAVDAKGRITSASNVSIPTATSGQLGLMEVGSGLSVASGVVSLASTGATGAYLNGGNSFGQAATLGTNDAYTLGLKTNGTTQMTIDTAGNVGIGTTSPAANLDVWASGGDMLDVGSWGVTVHNGSINSQASYGGAYASSSATSGAPLGDENSAATLGTSNNSSTDNSAAYLSLTAHNSQANNQAAYIGTVSNTGAGTYTPSIVIGQQTGASAYAERMRIDQNGNVGIGTTSPSYGLDVEGAYNGAGFGVRVRNNSSLGSATAQISTVNDGSSTLAMMTTSTTNSGANIGANANELYSVGVMNIAAASSGSTGIIKFFTQGDTAPNERMRIDSGGNVGIGTTSPGARLDVLTTTGNGINALSSAAGGYGISASSTGSGGIALGVQGTGTNAYAVYSSIGTNYFAGNVGIGEVSPSAALHLKAGVAAAGGAPLKLTAGTSLTTPEPGAIEYDGTSLFYTDSSSVRHTLAAAGGGITALTGDVTASGSGSVAATLATTGVTAATYGSATQVPQIAVDAKGRITSASNVSIPTATSGQLGLMEVGSGLSVASGVVSLASTGATGAYLNGGNSFGQAATLGTNDAYTLGLKTNGTTQMTIDTAGNVGIGTTSPGNMLDLNGGVTIRSATGSSLGSTSTYPNIALYDGGNITSNGGYARVFQTNATLTASANGDELTALRITPNVARGSFTGTTSYGLYVSPSSGSLDYGVFSDASNNYFSGNVGIGTTSPQAQIDAEGGDASSGISILGSSGVNAGIGIRGMATAANGTGIMGNATASGGIGVSGYSNAGTAGYFQSGLATNTSPTLVTEQVGAGTADLFQAQNSSGTSLFKITSAGSVGIGTTSPITKLEVGGGIIRALDSGSFSAPASGTGLEIYSVSGTGTIQEINRGSSTYGPLNINASSIGLWGNGSFGMTITSNGNVGIGTTLPTAALQLKAGVATAGGAPLKLTAGTSLTTPEPGAIEYDGTSLYYTDSSSVRHTLAAAGAGITALTGDVSASGSGSVAATVNSVGGSTAANVHTAELAANAATNANTASTIVKRDASGNFSAGAVSVGSSIFRDTGSNTVTLEAPTTVTSYVLKLPASQGAANTVLTEDGSGNLTWSAPAVSGTATLASGDMWVGNGSNVATAVAMSGDATLASSGTLTLAPSGVTAATYGSATQVPQIAVDAKGRITSASNMSIPTATGAQLGLMEVGTGLSVAAGVVSVANTGATGAYLNGGNSFGQAATLGTNDAYTLGFKTNGSTRMTIDTAGNVGLGTTSPISPFDVEGTITQGAASTYYFANHTLFDVAPSSASSSNGYWGSFTRLTSSSDNIASQDLHGSDNSIQLYSPATTTVNSAVAESGQVAQYSGRTLTYGIGGSFSVLINSSGAITNAYGVQTGVTQTAGTITNAYGVDIGSVQGSNKWSLYASDSTAPSYFAGNVGIGTTSPGAALNVYSSSASGAGMLIQNSNSSVGNPTLVGYKATNDAGNIAMLGVMGSGANYGSLLTNDAYILASGNLDLYSNNGSAAIRFINGSGEMMRIADSTGDVGIGTTSPTAALQLKAGVAAAGGAPLKLTAGTSLTTPEPGAIEYDGTSLFYTDSSSVRHALGSGGSGITALTGDVTASGSGSVAATLATTGVTAATYGSATQVPQIAVDAKGRITSASNVSIPTATGAQLGLMEVGSGLNVASGVVSLASTGATGAYLNGGNSFGQAATLGTNDAYTLGFKTNGTTQMTIDTAGNVGIGTTSPAATLQVAMPSTATSGISVGTTYAGTGSPTALSIGLNATSEASSGTEIGLYNVVDDSSSATSATTIASDNWVLSANSNASAVSGGQFLATYTGTGSPSVTGLTASVTSSSGGNTSVLYGVSSQVSYIGNVSSTYGLYTSVSASGGIATSAYGLYLGTIAGTYKWSVYASDATAPSYFAGNVGIGTTSPQAGLDIATTGTGASAIIVPRDTTTNRPSTPVNGMIRYNTTLNTFEGYMYGMWTALSNAIVGRANITSSPYTIAATQAGVYLSYNNLAAGTINLPQISTIPDGWQVTIMRKVAESVTITPYAGDSFDNGLTSFEMQGNNVKSLTLTNNGGNWTITNKTDDCVVGQSCWGTGNIFVGVYTISGTPHQMFTTPGNCVSGSPYTCNGATDTTVLSWASTTPASDTMENLTNAVDGQAQTVTEAALSGTQAAQFCQNMNSGAGFAGYTDWYLPSNQELVLLFNKSAAVGGFTYTNAYWSSTEHNATSAFVFGFGVGSLSYGTKTGTYVVRCVRRF